MGSTEIKHLRECGFVGSKRRDYLHHIEGLPTPISVVYQLYLRSNKAAAFRSSADFSSNFAYHNRVPHCEVFKTIDDNFRHSSCHVVWASASRITRRSSIYDAHTQVTNFSTLHGRPKTLEGGTFRRKGCQQPIETCAAWGSTFLSIRALSGVNIELPAEVPKQCLLPNLIILTSRRLGAKTHGAPTQESIREEYEKLWNRDEQNHLPRAVHELLETPDSSYRLENLERCPAARAEKRISFL